MSDLISREAALQAVNAYDYRGLTLEDVRKVTDGCANAIKNLTAVDAEPVRHAKWEHGMRCTSCRQVDTTKPNYCPNCGAKMDLEDT